MDEATHPQPVAASEPASAATDGVGATRGWRDAWQIPTAIFGAVLIVLGISTLSRRAPGPDFEGVLADAAALIERPQPAAALDLLNGPIVEALGKPGAADPETLARFHSLRGEALFLAHREARLPMDTPQARANNLRTLEEFERATHYDKQSLTPKRQGMIAEVLLDLGRVEDALARLDHLAASESDRRRRLLKRIAEADLAGPPALRERAMKVLHRMLDDAVLEEPDRVWAVSRQQRLRLSRGEAERVIEELLPELQRLNRLDSSEAAELHLLLGDAYLEIGDLEQARSHLGQVETILSPGDERRGRVDASLARIAQSRGDIDEARDRFASVVERFPGASPYAEALLGLGESEADIGNVKESLRAYAALVDLLRAGSGVGSVTPEQAEASMDQRYRGRLGSGELETALKYAELIVSAYPAGRAPATALLRLAESNRRIADQLLGGLPDELEAAGRLALLDADTVERARIHLRRAGEAYEQHVRAAMVTAPEEASASLWNAADVFDRAGDQERAIRLFTEYAHDRLQDPRQLEAKYRLGRCFQALNQYATAIALFQEIIRANPGSDEAFRSYVPLAQCHLAVSNDADAEAADRLLLQVLDGRLFQPEAPQFKRALLELGQLYLRIGRYPDAIMRLNEALSRYPDAPETTRLRFDLADAMRLSAAQIERQLKAAMPVSERVELERLRAERLQGALSLYEQVRSALDGGDPTRLTPLQRILLRNSILYRGDCAFDLGDYEAAIRHYDSAAQRLANDPASLVPMIQIVNCYAALGRLPEARTAHERAKARLKELPDAVWKGASVPMDRRHWERWLESSLRLDQMEAKASAAAPEP